MARPESVECEVCGTEVKVSAKGRIPRFCAEHTAADLDQRTDSEREADENAELGRRQIAEAAQAAEPVDDGWPRQIAPVVWVDQKGRRYNDQGAAERAAEELRG